MENQQFEDVNVLLSTFVAGLVSAIVYMFTNNQKIMNKHKKELQEKNVEHIADLKLFDEENKKDKKELIDAFNKIILTLEEEKIGRKDVRTKIERVVSLLENLKDKVK